MSTIPKQVQEYCKGLKVEYCGTYHEFQVFSVVFSDDEAFADDEITADPPCIGCPSFILWDPKKPNAIRQVSDQTLEIFCHVSDQQQAKQQKNKKHK